MTIKRRLFVSNILMILIPFLASLIVFQAGLYVFTSVTGMRPPRKIDREEQRFETVVDDVRRIAEKFRALDDEVVLLAETAYFNEVTRRTWGRRSVPVLLVFKGGTRIFPVAFEEETAQLDAAAGGESSLTLFGRTSTYTEVVGGHRLVLVQSAFFEKGPYNFRDVMFAGTLFSLGCAVVVVLLTNRFLTQFVFRRILYAMETLSSGVRQIRDGNLDYRIHYAEADEFSPICEDFNEMARQLQESAEMKRRDEASRRELIAGISHDLRTPLTSIKAYIEGLEKGVAATPGTQERYLGIVRKKADELEGIIEKLFHFSKLDTDEFPYRIERIRLPDLMGELVASVGEEYEAKGLDLFLFENAERSVEVDIAQFRNVIVNILENSLKYNDKERAAMEVQVRETGGMAEIVLTDNGPGVPKEDLERLFDVFFRSDPSRRDPGQGSGLGLAIAAKTVTHFGGTIRAENGPRGGLSIAIRLPLCE